MEIHSIINAAAYNADNGDKIGTFIVPWLAIDDDAPKGVVPAITFKEGKTTLTGRELLSIFDSVNDFPWTFACRGICQMNLTTNILLVKQGKAKVVGKQTPFQQGMSKHTDIRVLNE